MPTLRFFALLIIIGFMIAPLCWDLGTQLEQACIDEMAKYKTCSFSGCCAMVLLVFGIPWPFRPQASKLIGFNATCWALTLPWCFWLGHVF